MTPRQRMKQEQLQKELENILKQKNKLYEDILKRIKKNDIHK